MIIIMDIIQGNSSFIELFQRNFDCTEVLKFLKLAEQEARFSRLENAWQTISVVAIELEKSAARKLVLLEQQCFL